jgi:eukaryotic-like serine/threonine-protein kinase
VTTHRTRSLETTRSTTAVTLQGENAAQALERLHALLAVSKPAATYRGACAEAIGLVLRLDSSDVVLEQFLSPFIATGPLTAPEAEVFLQLAAHYETQGLLANAEEVLRKVEGAFPGREGTQDALERVRAARAQPRGDSPRILAEEASFVGARRRLRPNDTLASNSPTRAPAAQSTAAAHLPPAFALRQVVAGRYRLDEVIGRGGMGVICAATDLCCQEERALKLLCNPLPSADLQTRMEREVDLSRRLDHRNILRLYDLATHSGHAVIVMERLRGRDLRQLQDAAPPSVHESIEYLAQVCAGLTAAHQLGVVHRDIKPENLFVTSDGVVKITDFGIARLTAAPKITLTGMLWGTPRYMAPEQVSDFSSVGPAADLYSLGVVAFELLTHRLPLDHPDLNQLLVLQLTAEPPRLCSLCPGLPAQLDALVASLLQKDPRARPQTAREVGERLLRALSQLGDVSTESV